MDDRAKLVRNLPAQVRWLYPYHAPVGWVRPSFCVRLFFQRVQQAADGGGWALQLDLPSCDDDVCGAVVMVVVLVILTFVLVIGSAFIPHFWLFSGSIFLGIMALIAIHDLRIRRPYRNEG